MAAASIDGPLVEFFQMMPNRRPPQRADRAVGGVIPARALRYCEAITSASAFGWYVFLPISFKVVWDGHDMLWTYDGVEEWLPLTRDAVQYPQFSEQFNEIAPASVRGFSPPFLTPSIQPGGLQVWTGCIAKSAPGWSLLVRGVANLSPSASYQMFEGIIETDSWFGPLFNNVRIIKTDVPIEFRSDTSRLAKRTNGPGDSRRISPDSAQGRETAELRFSLRDRTPSLRRDPGSKPGALPR